MFKLKGIAAVATAIAMLLPISAQASDKSYKLVLAAESGDRNSVNGKAVASWASMIKEKSKGRMKVNVFYQGELGGQQEMFDQLVKGNIHMMLTWPQTSYDKRIVVNYIPYLVLDWDDAIKSYGQDGWLAAQDHGPGIQGYRPEVFRPLPRRLRWDRHQGPLRDKRREGEGHQGPFAADLPAAADRASHGIRGRADRLGRSVHVDPDGRRGRRFVQRDLLGLRVFPRPAQLLRAVLAQFRVLLAADERRDLGQDGRRRPRHHRIGGAGGDRAAVQERQGRRRQVGRGGAEGRHQVHRADAAGKGRLGRARAQDRVAADREGTGLRDHDPGPRQRLDA
ncbi:hypothetical protein GO615_11095 [Aromatoleum evansii]|nr:hypothetical protein [Aromatoleum evansii]